MPNDEQAAASELAQKIEAEANNHGITWCHSKCPNFVPERYMQKRIEGATAQALQGDYDSCHLPYNNV